MGWWTGSGERGRAEILCWTYHWDQWMSMFSREKWTERSGIWFESLSEPTTLPAMHETASKARALARLSVSARRCFAAKRVHFVRWSRGRLVPGSLFSSHYSARSSFYLIAFHFHLSKNVTRSQAKYYFPSFPRHSSVAKEGIWQEYAPAVKSLRWLARPFPGGGARTASVD